jgi:hypothetical protein
LAPFQVLEIVRVEPESFAPAMPESRASPLPVPQPAASGLTGLTGLTANPKVWGPGVPVTRLSLVPPGLFLEYPLYFFEDLGREKIENSFSPGQKYHWGWPGVGKEESPWSFRLLTMRNGSGKRKKLVRREVNLSIMIYYQ